MQRLPVSHGLVPFHRGGLAAGQMPWRQGSPADVVDGFVVDSHQAGPCTGLNRHVAHCHAPLHAQGTNRRSPEFDGVAGAAGSADAANDSQHNVFATAAAWQHAIDLDQHVLGFLGQQGLRGQHVFDFAGANAMCQSAKGTMGRRVGVAADHRHPRQRGAIFRANHMDDTLAFGQERKVGG